MIRKRNIYILNMPCVEILTAATKVRVPSLHSDPCESQEERVRAVPPASPTCSSLFQTRLRRCPEDLQQLRPLLPCFCSSTRESESQEAASERGAQGETGRSRGPRQ